MLRKIKTLPLKVFLLCLLSAILLILSFPNYNIYLLAWFGFVPLFFALRHKSKLKTFFLAYLTGIIFWTGVIYWLVHVTLPGTILLILYLALYFGIFGLIIKTYNLRLITYNLIFIPSLWVLLEYIRSHLFTGFPWALLGYSQYLNLPIIQIADITGAWGISFLVMMVNVAVFNLIAGKSKKSVILPAFILILSLIYGYYRLNSQPRTQDSQLKISVVQGNIPQELKWQPRAREFIMHKYINLTKQAAKDNPDLIIWPEAALPAILEEEPRFFEQVESLAKEINKPLFFGAVTSRNSLYYNSAIFISGQGKELERYDKLHLVPFGEYIPLKNIFSFLETVVPIGDIAPGKEYVIFKIPNSATKIGGLAHSATKQGGPAKHCGGHFGENLAVLICFEDLFPQISREFVKRGADFLVNITNDAWYKKTSASSQHLQASVFRAVENRVNLVRSANTGISGFIALTGKIVALVQDKSGKNIFVDGYKTEEINICKRSLTFYTRFGDIFIALSLLFVIIFAFKRKQ